MLKLIELLNIKTADTTRQLDSQLVGYTAANARAQHTAKLQEPLNNHV